MNGLLWTFIIQHHLKGKWCPFCHVYYSLDSSNSSETNQHVCRSANVDYIFDIASEQNFRTWIYWEGLCLSLKSEWGISNGRTNGDGRQALFYYQYPFLASFHYIFLCFTLLFNTLTRTLNNMISYMDNSFQETSSHELILCVF